ncbi:MAG: hypothetical protein U0840_25550 [Gemmataceae bacterium]
MATLSCRTDGCANPVRASTRCGYCRPCQVRARNAGYRSSAHRRQNNRMVEEVQRSPEREARVARYAERAAMGLPLFG